MARRSIQGLRTLVTGASSGIGRALSIELVGRGAAVMATARRRDRLEELGDEIRSRQHDIFVIDGDITSADFRRRLIEEADARLGGLDALVNNAGVGAVGSFAEADADRLRRVMEVNFFAPAELTRLAIPRLMGSGRGIVVNVGSVLGHRAVPGKSEYCASKFAIHGLGDALRAELAGDGIDLLHVCPSTTDSEFFDRLLEGEDPSKARTRKLSPQAVARKTVNAIGAGRGEIIVSLEGKLLVWLDRLCPPLANWLIARRA